ncbi:hypothetical protein [Paraburkholderia sp. 35.1]|uniref:hypothetical protein n=1 Tax=Paraburkholderia sp. 35.1 TaxID=2991058 RepID=UPI003D21C5E1
MNTNNRLTRQTLALRVHLAHDNERLREALRLIVEMCENTTSALTLDDVARVARTALVHATPENEALRHPDEGVNALTNAPARSSPGQV